MGARPFSYYVVVSTLVLLGVIGLLCVVMPPLLPLLPPSYHRAHPLAQLAALQLALEVVGYWLVCTLFYAGDCWMFDSLGWPMCAVFASLFHVRGAEGLAARQDAVLLLSVLYAVRLNASYFRENGWSCIGLEDWRYGDIRVQLASRGIGWAIPSLVLVFIVQWAMVFLATMPIYTLMRSNESMDAWDVAAVAAILCAALFEMIADNQLYHHRCNSRQLLTKGLWAISRHPNYFGQAAQWLAWGAWAWARGAPWWVAVGPLNIAALVVFYSAPFMEKRCATGARGKELTEAQRHISMLIPIPFDLSHLPAVLRPLFGIRK